LNRLGCHLFPWNSIVEQKGLLSEEVIQILRWIHSQGFDSIETSIRFIPRENVEKLKEVLITNALTISGIHVGLPIFDKNYKVDKELLVSQLQVIHSVGAEFLVVSGNREETITFDQIDHACKILNEIGEICSLNGIQLVYHNHDYEFTNHGVMESLLANTHPIQVKYALDVGWAYLASVDPIEFFLNSPERFGYFHLRDVQGNSFIELGKGEIPYQQFLAATRTHNYCGPYVIEMELGDHYCGSCTTAEDSVLLSLQYLRSM
jgi:sugar phosphate isomerase/epimerase